MSVETARGFTLLEILIAVAIVGILVAIAYPSYQDQIIKSKRAEGKAILITTVQALEKCKALYGSYDDVSCSVRNDLITGGTHPVSENGYYAVSASGGSVTATSFTLQAVPTGFTDSDCGNLTITEDGTRGRSGSGTNCW